MTNKPVYIMSLEASDIYYHQHREMYLKRDYVGMIPFSLELIKLHKTGLKTKYIEQRDKYISDDIINVKFNSKVKHADEMLSIYRKKLEFAKKSEIQDSLQNYIGILEEHSTKADDVEDMWEEITIDNLRHSLYTEGFSITFINPRTKSEKTEDYVVYKRSSAKSRTGQCLFIKKKLYKKMIDWSRMYLPLRKGQGIDLASLLAYESLVGSSLEDTIEIDVDKILIVDDVESRFKKECNVVRANKETGFLDSFKEECEVVNSLFDGESLLESKYFTNNQGMILLRNHMFKSASFNCNIQKFLEDNCPSNIEYDDWQIENMFGEKILAKNIEMICTPTSLKALKFAHTLPSKTEKEMWNHWKELVKSESNVFGICKHEKKSKIGYDENGNVLQQTSYQMINCLPASPNDILKLTSTERNYIDKLKNDNDFLMEEIYKKRDETNSNNVIYTLYHHNKKIVDTKLYRDFKDRFVNKQLSHAKKGKIKINGDYCVLLGNPIEFLYHAINQWDKKSNLKFEYNEVYTSLYEDGIEMVGFRNPNTSPSNVLIMRNKKSKFVDTYFNITQNIIIVNAINFAIQDILSGCDYDSDTMLVSNESALVALGKRCFEEYLPCINQIEGKKKKYKLTLFDHYEIDKQLSHSQFYIGKVVNLGQFCMSAYWDLINNNEQGVHVNELLKKVDVMTILSGIAIDMAKKFYDIDMECEINLVSKNSELEKRKKKPNFWVYVSQNKNTKKKITGYDCPMDYLIKVLNFESRSDKNPIIYFDEILEDMSSLKVNTRQLKNIRTLIQEYNDEVVNINITTSDRTLLYEKLERVSNGYVKKIKGWKLKKETISFAIRQTYDDGDNYLLKMLKFLYEIQPEELLKCIKKG